MPVTAQYRTGGPTPKVGQAVLDEITRLVEQGYYWTPWRPSFGKARRVTELHVDDDAQTVTVRTDQGEHVIERFIELILWPETIGHQQGRIIVIGNNASGDGYIGRLELLPPDRLDDAGRCAQFEAALDEARARIDAVAEAERRQKRDFADSIAATLGHRNWVRLESESPDRIVLNWANLVEIVISVRVDGIDIDLHEDPNITDRANVHSYLSHAYAVLEGAIGTAASNTFNVKVFS